MAITHDVQVFDVQIAAGTTNNAWTFTPDANDQEIDVEVKCMARAVSETAGYHKEASFEKRSSTLVQLGVMQNNAGDREDDATWDIDINQSAGVIRVRGTADATNATNFAGIVYLTIRK